MSEVINKTTGKPPSQVVSAASLNPGVKPSTKAVPAVSPPAGAKPPASGAPAAPGNFDPTQTRLVRSDGRRLGEIITECTKVTEAEITDTLAKCKETGLSLGEQLFRDGRITDEERARCLSIQWGMKFLDLAKSRPSKAALELVDPTFQRENQVLALQQNNGILTVAIVDPLNVDPLDAIRLTTGLDIKPVMVAPSALQAKFQELFGETPEKAPAVEEKPSGDDALALDTSQISNIVEAAADDMSVEVVASKEVVDDTHALGSMAEQAPIIRLVDGILAQGIKEGASDIHMQAEESCFQVRYRVDGLLHDGPKVPKSLMRVVVARIKVMAKMDLAARRSPQDGRLSLRAGARNFELRVSILPCVKGPKVVMRIAEQASNMIGLDKLGFEEDNLKKLRELIARPNGIVLITGPTGSGKSTTLYSIIAEISMPDTNILTVEDPVELQFPGISQAEINEKAGLSFAACLRAALRQDPDVIMVGEIRDTETAEIAIHASLTGHLVLSTLHTNDAPSAVTRLVDMGIEPFLVASSLIGVLAQRLARRLCSTCSEDLELTVDQIRKYEIPVALDQSVTIKKPKGCEKCGNKGYKGRLGVHEVLMISEAVKFMILDGKGDAFIRKLAIEEGMKTLKDDVFTKVLAGRTTLEEAHAMVTI
ncbi:MAG: type II/IV secretion system protein [Planctomycetes bacterium]|nr:type II/IV secretion system protein [Planctomycetota bacterium]